MASRHSVGRVRSAPPPVVSSRASMRTSFAHRPPFRRRPSRRLDVSMRTSYRAAPPNSEVPMLVSDLAHGFGNPRWSRRLDVSMRTSYSGARCQGRRLDVSMRTSSPRIPGSPHINTSHITHPHHTPRSTDHKSHTRHHKHITHLTPQHTSNTLGHSVTHPGVRGVSPAVCRITVRRVRAGFLFVGFLFVGSGDTLVCVAKLTQR